MTQWGLDTLFNPAKRHMDEEKRRLQSTREEIGDSSGGKRIDLESGKVSIPRTASDADLDSENREVQETAATHVVGPPAQDAEKDAAVPEAPVESPARARARARRARG